MEAVTLVYLSCADVFAAQGDHQTERLVLDAGYHELIARSRKISDPAWRESFLNNVPEHRDMLRRWQALQVASGVEAAEPEPTGIDISFGG